nr:hypothetical protein [Tanacetum cinerariifolium]
KWHPDENLLKEHISTVPVWVKLYGVPVTAFSEDGLSAIATKMGTPLMLDYYTSDMCMQYWGRSSYARVTIELRVDVDLKDNIVVAMPKIIREGHYICSGEKKIVKKPSQTSRGVSVGVEPTIEDSNSNPFDVLNSVDNDVEFGTNWGTTNSNYFDCPPDSYHPPHPTYETYSGDSCGNNSQFVYHCPSQFPLNYEPEPGYIQNYNSYPHDSSSFPQQYPCCEDCGVTHEPYQCQPKNHDYYHEQNSCYDSNSIGFDQSQPQQYTINHHIFNTHHDLLGSQKKLNITLTKVTEQMTQLTSMCELACQLVQKNLEEKRIKEKQAAKAQSWKLPVCYDDDDDEEGYNSLNDNIIFELPSYSAVTPTEPIDFLSIGDEHLDTIPAMESDKFIKSCV